MRDWGRVSPGTGTLDEKQEARWLSRSESPEEDRLEIFPDQTEKIESREMLIYIIPKKIPKARLQVLNNLAQRKGFPIQ